MPWLIFSTAKKLPPWKSRAWLLDAPCAIADSSRLPPKSRPLERIRFSSLAIRGALQFGLIVFQPIPDALDCVRLFAAAGEIDCVLRAGNRFLWPLHHCQRLGQVFPYLEQIRV